MHHMAIPVSYIVQTIVADRVGVMPDKARRELTIAEIGGDDNDRIRIVETLEKRFGLSLPDSLMDDEVRVADLIAAVEPRQAVA